MHVTDPPADFSLLWWFGPGLEPVFHPLFIAQLPCGLLGVEAPQENLGIWRNPQTESWQRVQGFSATDPAAKPGPGRD